MPTDYTVRESARAKHVRFRVTVSDGLIVVIPKGFDRQRIPGLVEEKRDWIVRALEQIEAHSAEMTRADRRPQTIEFPAIGERWRLEWCETDAPRVSVSEIGRFQLSVQGPICDRAAWRPALRRWLIERGREHLIPWVEDLAQTLGIQVHRVSIRCQKTRWGSYSTKGTISPNAQLLFLPERLVRFVLLHELCHTVHSNHSPRFWDLVRTHEPDADRLRKELRCAWKNVPHWISKIPS